MDDNSPGQDPAPNPTPPGTFMHHDTFFPTEKNVRRRSLGKHNPVLAIKTNDKHCHSSCKDRTKQREMDADVPVIFGSAAGHGVPRGSVTVVLPASLPLRHLQEGW